MPERVCGILGYEFSEHGTVSGVDLVPLHPRATAKELASDGEALHVTGYARFVVPNDDVWADVGTAFLLAAGMSFAQQQQVVLTHPIELSPGDTLEELWSPARMGGAIPMLHERSSFGSAVVPDSVVSTSRLLFLELFLDRFRVEIPGGDPLRQAFFRQIEISRSGAAFIEVQHYLAFSGLELLARAAGVHSGNKNAAVPISHYLNARGFPNSQNEIQLWTHARNAAFHRGQLVSEHPKGGPQVRLADQLYQVTTVLELALLRELQFDDGLINWTKWRDRMGYA